MRVLERRAVLSWLCLSGVACSQDGVVTLNGAGASFPFPLYSKWIEEYRAVSPRVRINYQSIGSGAGVRQVVARTVDFGATDVPPDPDETRETTSALVVVPAAVGCVVLSYNLPALASPLKLTRELVAAIYLGAITRWSDPALVSVNPGAGLPDQPISVVFRADGSGTSALFTRYLALANAEWRLRVGSGKSVRWPVGIGAKGNEGVTGQLQATPGSLGYTELAYATQNQLSLAAVKNHAGRFVLPSADSAASAAAATPSAAAFAPLPWLSAQSLADATSDDAYPLAAYTYFLLSADHTDANRGRALAEFVWWALHDGQRFTRSLGYAPLPAHLLAAVEKTLRSLKAAGKPALTR